MDQVLASIVDRELSAARNGFVLPRMAG